ncbi:TIGR03086 family metal-binding protein [Acrocarpospora sp. B8E8]|uniref:TIGR03086 family metal-binding protein n=1 Tax=Acrocarpospora sp. B8E8 TaxID=3153572 RepID=UPI00325E43C8
MTRRLDVSYMDEVPKISDIAARYQSRANAFEAKIIAVRPEQWSNQSPCTDWNARDVVRHIIDMHAAMLRPLDRTLSPAPTVDEDPLAAFRTARADVETLLHTPELATTTTETPSGPMSVEDHIDQVVSADMVLHGWDLAKATGQDPTMNPSEVLAMWPTVQHVPDKLRIPEAFGPGIIVYGPEVKVAEDSSLQDRILGLIGRDPNWTPPN